MEALRTLLAILLFMISFGDGNCQQEHMNWYFGNGVGLNFSSGTPVPVTGSMMVTLESCSSISNQTGNILFYTNGLNVWDASNTVMPNGSGLLGNESSQCMIIPKPGATGVYYIVAADATNSLIPEGITYSEVDMSLNGGLGDITAIKNVTLLGNATEFITAVPHSNCEDTWIICHGMDNESVLNAFHVSATGINPVPVTSDLGFYFTQGISIGMIRPNPVTGQLVVAQTYLNGAIDLIDFDRLTGSASLDQHLFTGINADMSYGIEFSRSGSKLYISDVYGGGVFQYDLTAANIPASRTLIGSGSSGQLQIAPNNKIYVNSQSSIGVDYFLDVINNPEATGLACNYVEDAVTLPDTALLGLPWYYNSNQMMSGAPDLGNDLVLCTGTVELNPFSSSSAPGVFEWSDGSNNPTLSVAESGTYWVSYQVGSCEMITDSIVVIIDKSTLINPLTDTTGCPVLKIHSFVENLGEFEEVNWHVSNGNVIAGPIFDYSFPYSGMYRVYLSAETINGCMVQTDSVWINVLQNPDADFSANPSPFIVGETIHLTDESGGNVTSWKWIYEDEMISQQSYAVITPTVYDNAEVTLIVQNETGCSDTLRKIIPLNTNDLVYVPNSFSPNGDGINDEFMPSDILGNVHEMIVYNRWGEMVWKSDEESKSWNGTYRGDAVPNGTYTWHMVLKTGEIVSQELTGHVNLIR